MDVGIGIPAMIPGVSGERILDWARKADDGPFSSIGIIDRLVYPNYEPMIALAAAAGATRRIRLMTTVLLAPLRHGGNLAKQAASLDAISGGRFTLGVGIGGRPDDYAAAPANFRSRGRRFDEQLALMKRVWAGEPVGDGVGPVGPPPARPGGPELIIGGFAAAALARVGRWGDGYMAAGGSPDDIKGIYSQVEQAWSAAGRSGKPRLVCGAYWALGDGVAERGAAYIRDYYGFAGPMAEALVQSQLTTDAAVKGALLAYADAGVDELVLWPTTADLEMVDRLAQAVG